jgi:hypothetical protein
MVKPLKYDPLSVCGMFAAYQVNFANIVITACLTAAVMFISVYLLIRQVRGEKETRKKKPSMFLAAAAPKEHDAAAVVHNDRGEEIVEITPGGNEEEIAVSSVSNKSATGRRGISFSFVDLTVEARRVIQLDDGSTVKERFQILPGVYGYVRPGTVTCILGPTGCGKSTLLSMLRVGGEGSSGGSVDAKLHSGRGGHGNGTSTADFASLEAGGVAGGADEGDQHRSITDRDELKSRIGFVPQDDILDRALTVREVRAI